MFVFLIFPSKLNQKVLKLVQYKFSSNIFLLTVSYFVCKIFVDLKILTIIFPAILGYQFVQSEKMINLLSVIARNKPHHVKVSKPVVHLR